MTTGATAQVKGGFWPQNGVTSLASISGKGAQRRVIAQMFDAKGQFDQRALLTALDGVVPGSNATKTLSRIEANVELGGKRVVETETLINRNTAAGDVTELNADYLTMTSRTSFGGSPKPNLDGNPLGTR